MAIKPVKLQHSSCVLTFVDGSWDSDVLESLLEEASSLHLKKSQFILATKERRAKPFNEDNPEWVQVPYSVKLAALYRMYESDTGEQFNPKTDEQTERDRIQKRARMVFY